MPKNLYLIQTKALALFLILFVTTGTIVANPPAQSELLIINEHCPTNDQLVLRHIEYKPDETLLHFTYTNTTLIHEEDMRIWCDFSDDNDLFTIEDLKTSQRYYALDATIGISRENGTEVLLGQSHDFKVRFPSLPRDMERVNITEGEESEWKFLDLDLSYYRNLVTPQVIDENFTKAIRLFQEDKVFTAREFLFNLDQLGQLNHRTFNLLGVVSYVIDNHGDAIRFFTRAIELSPNDDTYYANRMLMYITNHVIDKAKEDLDKSIELSPYHYDYYIARAYYYMQHDEWVKAIEDWDFLINKMGDESFFYLERSVCKSWIEDFEGSCRDLKEASRLENYEDEEILKLIKERCD